MAGKSYNTDIWTNYLLQNVRGYHFPNVQTLDSENNESEYQIFEVLVSETIQILYPDYCWRVTPYRGDGGIDFIGEREMRAMPTMFHIAPLVIYGQVKRRKRGFQEEQLIDATNKMIRYYMKHDRQKKSIQQLIHVVSSDCPIKQQIEEEIPNASSLAYVVTVINAEELFRLWANNPGFLNALLPNGYLSEQREKFLNAIEELYNVPSQMYTSEVTIDTPVYLNQAFDVEIVLTSLLSFPIPLTLRWIPVNGISPYLIFPQGLLKNDSDFKITLLHGYRLTMRLKSTAEGIQDLGKLRISTVFGSKVTDITLGTIDVKPTYNLAYFELPLLCSDKYFREDIDASTPNLSFYSVVGEGGIGKSTFLQEMMYYAVNYGYQTIHVKHECRRGDETDFWQNIFQQLAGGETGALIFQESFVMQLKEFMGSYYRNEWGTAIQELLETGTTKMSAELLNGWLCLSILAADKHPLFIWISNMHWCSTYTIDLFLRYLKLLKQNTNYFSNKIIIAFEGRTEETLDEKPQHIIPIEWLKFQKNAILREIRLHKWSDKQCRQYVDAMFALEHSSETYQESSRKLRQYIIDNGAGNPMHMYELVRYLIQKKNIICQKNGRIQILSSIIQPDVNTKILEIIKSRVTYYRKYYPDLIDFLILGAYLDDWNDFHQYVIYFCRNYMENNRGITEIKHTLYEMGFATINPQNGFFSFAHEHYKTVFSEEVLSLDESVEKLFEWSRTTNILLSPQMEARLLLLYHTINYDKVCKLLLDTLNKDISDSAYFETLYLLEKVPSQILEKYGMPLYHLYRLLESACMLMGNWETAEEYVNLVKKIDEDSPAYQIDLLFSRKSLANNYSFRMCFDAAQEECEDAVNNLEDYLSVEPEMTEEERKALYRELCLLKNRLAIIYFLSGRHKAAWELMREALYMSCQKRDHYVIYHIQYEMGLWVLRSDPELGCMMICNAYENLPLTEALPGTQEMDLLRADCHIAQLKVASKNREFSKTLLKEVKKDALEACRRLTLANERLESILHHALYAIVAVIERNTRVALKYFQEAAEVAYQANMSHEKWKMHLNMAQCYCLLLDEDPLLSEEYQTNISFHLRETANILEESLQENIYVHDTFQKVIAFPQEVVRQLSERIMPPEITGHWPGYCGNFIEVYHYFFFLLD